jgi:enoyl-CoA hydratase/carnithine racemase
VSSASFPQLRVEERKDFVVLAMDRERERNALSPTLVASLKDAISHFQAVEGVRAIVLTGSGEKAFSAGADLSSLGEAGNGPTGLASRYALAELFEAIWRARVPVVAMVRGYCLAGGMGLACACDIVIAADDAVFGTPEVRVGLWPAIISVPLLMCAPPRAVLELMITGRRVDARTAKELGFVNEVVPASELRSAVEAVIADIRKAAPEAVAVGKRAFYSLIGSPPFESLLPMASLLHALSESPSAKEGIAAFLEKRPPAWSKD